MSTETTTAPEFLPGTAVTFLAEQGNRYVTVSGVVTDSHLTRVSPNWRTVQVGGGTGYVTEVPVANLTAVRPPLVEPMDAPEVEVTVTRSGGADGAVLVLIDTKFEPDASDEGPGLRVLVNDHPTYAGVEFVHDGGDDREATEHRLTAAPTYDDTDAAPAANDELSTLRAAVARMAEVLGDGMTAGDTGGHFSCGEAEALADVLRAAGHTDAADTWIEGHAGSDDEGDDHWTEDPADVAHREAGKCGQTGTFGHRCGADAAEDSRYCTTHEHLSADD